MLEDVQFELELEVKPLANLPEFLSPGVVPRLVEELEKHRLFEPEAMAAIMADGGFRQALSDEAGEHYDYARLVVETTEGLRADVSAAVIAAAVTNAVVALPFVLSVPMLLIATIAVAGRLIRRVDSPKPVAQ